MAVGTTSRLRPVCTGGRHIAEGIDSNTRIGDHLTPGTAPVQKIIGPRNNGPDEPGSLALSELLRIRDKAGVGNGFCSLGRRFRDQCACELGDALGSFLISPGDRLLQFMLFGAFEGVGRIARLHLEGAVLLAQFL